MRRLRERALVVEQVGRVDPMDLLLVALEPKPLRPRHQEDKVAMAARVVAEALE